MSRTRKDVPYWVRTNRDGIFTDHDHTRFGKTYYKNVLVRDENNNPVYETVSLYMKASDITSGGWGPYDLRYSNGRLFYSFRAGNKVMFLKADGSGLREPIVRRAHLLVGAGRESELVEVGSVSLLKYEQVEAYTVADHCTEGVKASRAEYRYNGALPCTPALPASDRHWWRYGTTKVRRGEHDSYYGYERTRERAFKNNLKNAWNSGDSIEDWDEDDNYSGTKRDYVFW